MEKAKAESLSSRQDAAALGEQVYEHVLRQIIEVQIEPGERINVTKIADQLGVSRTPIRSAMGWPFLRQTISFTSRLSGPPATAI